MFGSGPQIGTIKTIIRIARQEIQKAHSMENIKCFEVDHLWIKRTGSVLPGATGICLALSLKTLGFVVQKITPLEINPPYEENNQV